MWQENRKIILIFFLRYFLPRNYKKTYGRNFFGMKFVQSSTNCSERDPGRNYWKNVGKSSGWHFGKIFKRNPPSDSGRYRSKNFGEITLNENQGAAWKELPGWSSERNLYKSPVKFWMKFRIKQPKRFRMNLREKYCQKYFGYKASGETIGEIPGYIRAEILGKSLAILFF